MLLEKSLRSSLIWWVLSYFEPDRWPNCHVGIILPAIRRMGHGDIFSILYPYSDCVVFFLKLTYITAKISFACLFRVFLYVVC